MYKIFPKSDDIASNYSVNIGYDDAQLYERFRLLLLVLIILIIINRQFLFINDSEDQDFKISSTEKVSYSEEARWQ